MTSGHLGQAGLGTEDICGPCDQLQSQLDPETAGICLSSHLTPLTLFLNQLFPNANTETLHSTPSRKDNIRLTLAKFPGKEHIDLAWVMCSLLNQSPCPNEWDTLIGWLGSRGFFFFFFETFASVSLP